MSARTSAAFGRVTSFDDAPPPLRTVRVLLTGFRPFDLDGDGAVDANASAIIPTRWVDRAEEITVDHPSGRVVRASITGAILDVVWSRDRPGSRTGAPGGADVLEDLVRARRPDVIVATGMRSNPFSVDKIASDVDHAGLEDNEGRSFTEARTQFQGRARPRGPRLIGTTLPVAQIEREWQAAGVDFAPSDSAGNYICNDVFYRAVWLDRHGPGARSLLAAGFVHVPSWAKEADLERAIGIVLKATIQSLPAAQLAVRR